MIPCPHAPSGCNYPEGECIGVCYQQCHRCPVQSTCSGPMADEIEIREGGGLFGVGGVLVERRVGWRCPTESGR